MFFVALAWAFASMSCSADQAANLAETRQVSSGSTSAPTSEKGMEDEGSVSAPTSVAGAFLMSCQQDPVVSVYMVSCLFHNENGEKHMVSKDQLSAVRFSTEGGGEESAINPSDIYWHKTEEEMHFSFAADLNAGKVKDVIAELSGKAIPEAQAIVEDASDSEPEKDLEGDSDSAAKGSARQMVPINALRETFDLQQPPPDDGKHYVYVRNHNDWKVEWEHHDCKKTPVLEVRGPWKNYNNRYVELYPDCIDWDSGRQAFIESYWINASIKISKTLEVSPGSSYKISFRYHKRHPKSGIRFSVNGSRHHETKGDQIDCGWNSNAGRKWEWKNEWCEFSETYEAQNEELTIEFADLTPANLRQRGMLLDDILVEKLP
jgi:hypothetical protein